MDFQELVRKMTAIDTASNAPVETKTDECGMVPNEMAPMAPQAPMMPPKEKEEATMNINITAKGDAIDDVLKLMTKVNPDMINQPEKPAMPTMSIMAPGMDGPMDGPEGPEMPPMPKPINKLIPDFDGDNDDMPGGEKDSMDLPKDHDDDHVMIKSLDKDGDKDHDMDDHDMEKDDEDDKEDKDEKEAWENEPDEDERSVHYQMNKLQGGMNRRKGTHPKVAGADNPMQKVKEGDLRASIKAELQRALAETKGAK